jgi:hypothetical protein
VSTEDDGVKEEDAAMSCTRKAAPPEPPRSPEPPSPLPGNPGDTFIDAFLASWKEHGRATIEKLRTDKPADYVRIALSLFAKGEDQEGDPLHELTDAELTERIETIAASIGLEIRPRAPARRAWAADEDGAAER